MRTLKWIITGLVAIVPAMGQVAGVENMTTEDLVRFTREVLIPERLKIIDGDIVVPMDFDETRATYEPDLWPNGVVPFEFANNVGSTNEALMTAAMQEWESLADVNFVPRNGEADYIRIIADSFNASEFAGHQGGRQRVWITSWTTHGTLVHELGHVLGFYHEQSRGDRNSFVQINFSNICQNCCTDSAGNAISCNSQFTIRPGSGDEYGPYDFGSVMHYSACAFSTCSPCNPSSANCATITVLAPNQAQQTLIGQRAGASFWDGRVMSFLYPESDWRFADANFGGIPFGTFLNPWPTFGAAYVTAPDGGTVWLKEGDYSALGRWSRPMRIEATFQPARLGS